MGYKSVVFLIICLFIGGNNFAQTPTGYQVKRVVIDPGHGGKDPGAIGTGRHKNTESDVALAVSLKVKDYILKYYDSVEVVMTRDDDTFVELRERTKIANEVKADLFISVHCNTNGNKSAYGSETYVIGMHKSESNFEVAKRENQVIFLEDNYEMNYEGFDPNAPETVIGLNMMQSVYLDQSISFADKVQKQFTNRVGRKNRGVKQAGYWVISYTMMPSVLIELGFISNNSEEDFLNSEKGQVYMASAIYRAFKEYKIEMEGVDVSVSGEAKKEEQKPSTEKAPVSNVEAGALTNELKSASSPVDYRVQVAVSNKKLELAKYNFKGHGDVSMTQSGKNYTYYLGHYSVFEEALEFQRQLREKDYKDAYIVAFYQGKKITLQEAEELTKKNK